VLYWWVVFKGFGFNLIRVLYKLLRELYMKTIGICGPSCSGKTTIAQALAKELDANSLSLDNFYILGTQKIYVKHNGEKLRTFERPELYDGNRLAIVVNELQKNGRSKFKAMLDFKKKEYQEIELVKKDFLILEGLHLFQYEQLNKLIEHKFYIDLPSEIMLERRAERMGRNHSDLTFLKIGPQEWEKYGLKQKDVPDVVILDGKEDLNTLSLKLLVSLLK